MPVYIVYARIYSLCLYIYFLCLPFVGFVFDATKNYDNSFNMAGGMFLAGGFLCCLLHLFVVRRRKFIKSDQP